MSNSEQDEKPDFDDADVGVRCPNCDSVLKVSSGRCLMCGIVVDETLLSLAGLSETKQDLGQGPIQVLDDESAQGEEPDTPIEADAAKAVPLVEDGEIAQDSHEVVVDIDPTDFDAADINLSPVQESIDAENAVDEMVIESVLIEKRSRIGIMLLGLFAILTGIVAFAILSSPEAVSLALLPTVTEQAMPATTTPTWTPLPPETQLPSVSPTATATALPTETPRPPRNHQVASGETLFSLSLRYSVTMDSIAAENGIEPNEGLQVSQNLLIPWPTATPPLEPIAINHGGRVIIADPTDCRMYEIKAGDTFLGIAHRERIELEALTGVNRFSDQTILQPGDLICIPKIIVGGQLPATAGPSPTPSEPPPPAGPNLLYPIEEAIIEPADQPFYLQWAAVKDLSPDEWYMVELTDLTTVDSHPLREFTRDNAVRIPVQWRPQEDSTHLFRWRVRIVNVTDQRQDGSFIYTFGGTNSEDALFYWPGAIPTATATATMTPTYTPQPE